jgi:hypothetical protein
LGIFRGEGRSYLERTKADVKEKTFNPMALDLPKKKKKLNILCKGKIARAIDRATELRS